MSKRYSKFLSLGICAVCVFLLTFSAFGQRELAGASEAKIALERLNVCGTVLMVAAHPDDENTAVLAYLARGWKVDTGYLSLTRGEGGQNLIGPEQGERLGLIRTEELLAARHIDGAQQFFTRAIDFGFTKTADETLQKWGRERILGDVVWTIRKFQPDVIILRFSGTLRDGHGQHQTSAILGKEAFSAAGDPSRFPEQLKWVPPWQAKRLLWNAFAFSREQEQEAQRMENRIQIDTGDYNPVLGFSYGEIAGMSRSMHRSQGMGSPERKGSRREYFVTVAGDPAKTGMFEDIDISWGRVPGGEAVGRILAGAAAQFEIAHPDHSVPKLLEARRALTELQGLYASRKLRDLDEAIALCAGLTVELNAERGTVVPGMPLNVAANAIVRSTVPVEVEKVSWAAREHEMQPGEILGVVLENNQPWTKPAIWRPKATTPYTQPYWLEQPRDGDVYRVAGQQLIGLPENPPMLEGTFHVRVAGVSIELVRPLEYRHVDRVYGERAQRVAVVPPVAVAMPQDALVFPNASPKTIEVGVRAELPGQSGMVRIAAPVGWKVSPESAPYRMRDAGEQAAIAIEVTPPPGGGRAELKGRAAADGREVTVGVDAIDYPHIPAQSLFPGSDSWLVRADIRTLARRVGYVVGAGDEVAQALRQIGVETVPLSADDLARGDLSRFDAVVTGVRAWNTRPDLRANAQRLYQYAEAGGTVVVQYNVLEGGFMGGDPKLLEHVGPYPIEIGRERVSVEQAPVAFPNPRLPLLHIPNEITEADFDGWVQERGLYFASKWDERYIPVLESHDPGEKPLLGGTLFTTVGKGAYVFTGFSWFRQLPAGVPGAYRVFANFISAGRALQGAR